MNIGVLIVTFAGKPLFYHSIYFAKKLKFISEIIFTSDSEKYKKMAKKIHRNIGEHTTLFMEFCFFLDER